MITNIHSTERYFRVTVGLFFMSLAFWGPSNLWFLLGFIPVATGLFGWCPMYTMLGVSTCKRNSSATSHLKPQFKDKR